MQTARLTAQACGEAGERDCSGGSLMFRLFRLPAARRLRHRSRGPGGSPMRAMRVLILVGRRSGKSCRVGSRAKSCLQLPARRALLIAPGLPGDQEMRERSARHRAERLHHVDAPETPAVRCEPAAALRERSGTDTLQSMPAARQPLDDLAWQQQQDPPCAALREALGRVVLVSHEIGAGVAPLCREVRRYVDALNTLHQRIATACEHVTLMAARAELGVTA
ncbi:MAG: cobU [Ramlibacter sp.]|nr:cobU [Ramlibacter sp.]